MASEDRERAGRLPSMIDAVLTFYVFPFSPSCGARYMRRSPTRWCLAPFHFTLLLSSARCLYLFTDPLLSWKVIEIAPASIRYYLASIVAKKPKSHDQNDTNNPRQNYKRTAMSLALEGKTTTTESPFQFRHV